MPNGVRPLLSGQNADLGSDPLAVWVTRYSLTRFGWLAALLLTAIGLYFTQAVLDIVSGSHGLVRVAMLPPAWAAIALVAVLAGVGIAGARSGRDADLVLPLCAAGLLAVPYLPWLPDRLPILRGL